MSEAGIGHGRDGPPTGPPSPFILPKGPDIRGRIHNLPGTSPGYGLADLSDPALWEVSVKSGMLPKGSGCRRKSAHRIIVSNRLRFQAFVPTLG